MPLVVRELRQRVVHHDFAVRRCRAALDSAIVFLSRWAFHRHEALISSTYGTELIDCPAARNRNDPRLGAPALRSITSRLAPDLKKDFLQQILGNGSVTEEADCKGKYQRRA